jgi:hypothetical protein
MSQLQDWHRQDLRETYQAGYTIAHETEHPSRRQRSRLSAISPAGCRPMANMFWTAAVKRLRRERESGKKALRFFGNELSARMPLGCRTKRHSLSQSCVRGET